jgi:hypothetical protein
MCSFFCFSCIHIEYLKLDPLNIGQSGEHQLKDSHGGQILNENQSVYIVYSLLFSCRTRNVALQTKHCCRKEAMFLICGVLQAMSMGAVL